MKLYLLKRKDAEGCWDYLIEVLVRAEDSKKARKLAHKFANRLHSLGSPDFDPDWLSPTLTSCRQVKVEGPPSILISDFWEA